MPISRKRVDQASGNAQLGGLNQGFASVGYQLFTGFAVMRRPAVDVATTLAPAINASTRPLRLDGAAGTPGARSTVVMAGGLKWLPGLAAP